MLAPFAPPKRKRPSDASAQTAVHFHAEDGALLRLTAKRRRPAREEMRPNRAPAGLADLDLF